jgi:iron complex outermembrane receptor protein
MPRPICCLIPFVAALHPVFAEEENSGDFLKPVVVTAESERTVPASAYTLPAAAAGGLKSETPLLETPQAVSVVGEEIIKDQDARKLEDVLRNVAGVSPGGYYDGWDYYRIRGFDSSFNTFWDGLRGDYGMNAEIFGLERVEVIKGPASTLYGQAPLGGLVNLVSKRPKHEREGEVGFTAGSFDYYQGSFDYSTPLFESETPGGVNVYGRFVGMYKDAGSFVDYVDTERLYLAPSLTFEFGKDTSLTLLANYTSDRGIFPMPLPASGTVLYNPNGEIPIERFLGLPGVSNMFEQSRLRLGYEFKHRFNDLVSLRQNFSFSRLEQDWNNVLYPSSLDADGRTLYLYPYDFLDEKLDRTGVDTALEFTFATGRIDHTAALGFDYYYDKSTSSNRQIDYPDFPGSYVPIDLFNPNYNFGIPKYGSVGSSETGSDAFGVYLQDHAKLTDEVTVTLGGRFDHASDRTSGESKDAFTPKAGVTWEFTEGVAAYANYARSFKPQWNSTDAAGSPVDPEEGENYETGLKYSLCDGRLTGMASVFHLTRENVATANLATPDPFDADVSGEQRSRGFEFETAAEPVDGLEITGAYTFIDAEVTKDSTLAEGTPLQGVPEHAVSAWVKYTVQEGTFEGFGVGLGGRYYSSQSGDQSHSFELPSYGLLDAALYYEQESYTVQVNFNNILDKRHFVGSFSDLYVLPGKPFNVSASVNWKF